MDKKKSADTEQKCFLKDVLDILGGKWAIPIIYTLLGGTMRFMELERSIPNINTRMLVKELKNMEENGIVIREVFATVPPTVEYSLTEKGKKLEPIITELYKWGQEFVV
ncbi:MAG: helix-turn-helix transcriptional regulator [Acidobacteria bacterium]|nr:helix-turn-helix transcriptional regulator [Acidobacteriota bacterium]